MLSPKKGLSSRLSQALLLIPFVNAVQILVLNERVGPKKVRPNYLPWVSETHVRLVHVDCDGPCQGSFNPVWLWGVVCRFNGATTISSLPPLDKR